ncbi:MAG: hypothetical protein K9W44_08640 [Candidatus Lokiarchaeota archaeon]|nr:hypothetical protein [Candidatus Harpocratesius repetitus]
MENFKKKYIQALESENSYQELIQIVLNLKKKGFNQDQVVSQFNDLLSYVIKKGNEKQEEILREVMDLIVGWCNQDMWLFKPD